MANNNVIIDVLQLLANSGLDYTPKPNARMVDAWTSVFADIPDAALTQAVHDYLKGETRWPAPARLRELAERIQRDHGRSVFADPSRERMGKIMYLGSDEVEVSKPAGYTGVMRVTDEKWILVQGGTNGY